MVTIIIVNENTKDALELCLLSIKKYTDYPYEVIVVDHSSTDGSLYLLNKFSWVKIIEISGLKIEERHGKALDIGVKNVKSKYFLTLDSDVEILDHNWLAEMVKKIKKTQGVFCGEMSPATRSELWGGFSERCLPYCLLVDTDFFNKFKCSFVPELVVNGFSFKCQKDTGASVWLITQKNNLNYCLIEQNIKNKIFHYGSITVASLYQSDEWQLWLEQLIGIYSKCSKVNINEYKAFFKKMIKIQKEKINLIKSRTKILCNDLKVKENSNTNKTHTYINDTLKELSLKLFNLGEFYFNSENYKLSIQKLKEASHYTASDFENHITKKLALVYSRQKRRQRVK